MSQWIRDRARALIYERDTPPGRSSPACVYCGRAVLLGLAAGDTDTTLRAATLDHVLPVQAGGSNHPENLVTACWRCNAAKGQRTPAEWEALAAAGELQPLPPWTYGTGAKRREPPAATMAERADLATLRPICDTDDCRDQAERIDRRRRDGAEGAREARRFARRRA